MTQSGPTAETTDRPPVPQVSAPKPEDEVQRLTRQLASVRARLELAEFALTHLGPGDKPLELRIQNMVQDAMAQAQALRVEGRKQVEALVAEAEQLRAFARRGAETSAGQARDEVMKKAEEMLEDANRFRLAAEANAAQVVRAAEAKYEEAQVRAADLLRSTELAHSEVMRKRSEIEEQVVAARAQAQAFVRSSTLEAEARARDLTDLARQHLADAQRQAEIIIRSAEQEARARLRVSDSPFPRDNSNEPAEPGSGRAMSETEKHQFNRVDHGRKFGRPQS